MPVFALILLRLGACPGVLPVWVFRDAPAKNSSGTQEPTAR
jgi:hypothetical protein